MIEGYLLSSGYLEPDEALKLLMIGPEYTQVAIKTKQAAQQLRFIRSETVKRFSGEALRMEQEAYQESFAKELERIVNQ